MDHLTADRLAEQDLRPGLYIFGTCRVCGSLWADLPDGRELGCDHLDLAIGLTAEPECPAPAPADGLF